uniref:Uncharacterized protein n=1 Tax=Pavo cristatus TaxID=9049 RepID=A0A8C9F535_PAVCR
MEEQLLRALGGLSLQPPPRRSPRRFGKTLVLLRGLPGSGKSTLASLSRSIALRSCLCILTPFCDATKRPYCKR